MIRYFRVMQLVEKYVKSYNKDPESENTYGNYYELYTYLCSEIFPEQSQDVMDSIVPNKNNKINLNKAVLTVNKGIMESILFQHEEFTEITRKIGQKIMNTFDN